MNGKPKSQRSFESVSSPSSESSFFNDSLSIPIYHNPLANNISSLPLPLDGKNFRSKSDGKHLTVIYDFMPVLLNKNRFF